MKKIVTCAALIALAACNDPVQPGAFSVTFQYSAVGAQPGGTFVATSDALPEGGTAMETSPAAVLVVQGTRSTGAGAFDWMSLHLGGELRRGATLTIVPMCETVAGCAQGYLNFGQPAGAAEPEIVCAFRSGSVRITASTTRRVAGTFSGTASCGGAATGDMHVTDGHFEVPLD